MSVYAIAEIDDHLQLLLFSLHRTSEGAKKAAEMGNEVKWEAVPNVSNYPIVDETFIPLQGKYTLRYGGGTVTVYIVKVSVLE